MKKQLINKNLQSYKQLRWLNRSEFNKKVLRPIAKSAFLGAVLGGVLVILITIFTLIFGMKWDLSYGESNQLGLSVIHWIKVLFGVLTAGTLGLYLVTYNSRYLKWSKNEQELKFQITISKIISFVFMAFLVISLSFL